MINKNDNLEDKTKYLAQLHFSVFLFGLSGLFGKLIILPALVIVWGRVFFSSTFLFGILKYKNKFEIIKSKALLIFIILGSILTLHWFSFFKSIQISTVAIGLITFSTFPFFVTIIEPYFFNEKFEVKNLILSIITLIGVFLIVPEFNLRNQITQGILWGLLSGFTYALLSIGNRKYVQKFSSLTISFYEQIVSTIILFPFIIKYLSDFTVKNISLLVLLGVVFTAISHSLFINSMKKIKAQTASIVSTLEPVYGIIFATIFLNEIININTLIGGILILSSVLYKTINSYYK
ncbi:MAG: DMT family transporter [Bacillota bacterium]